MSVGNMFLGQYIPADSKVHKLDPRCKILIIVVAMMFVFLFSSLASLMLWGIALPFLARLSKIPFNIFVKSVKPVLFLVIFTSIIHLFLTDGKVIMSFGFMSITFEGCVLALRMSLRLIYFVMYAGVLTLTTSPNELSCGLEALMKPFERIKFPAHEVAMMMTIALRFIPTLFEETERIMKAQKSRGADFETGGLLKRAKSYIPVLIPMFVLVFQRADTLAVAMESRCYRGGQGRTKMRPLVWGREENLACFFSFLFFISIAVFGGSFSRFL